MRGIRVCVHSDDVLGGLHAGEVLDRARDTERDIEVGGHGHAGLSDLGGVVDVACVDGAGGADEAGAVGRFGSRLARGDRQACDWPGDSEHGDVWLGSRR